MVPQTAGSLGTWVSTQRTSRRAGKLPKERVELLDRLGFAWEPGRVSLPGTQNPRSKLTPEQVRAIYGDPRPNKRIAKEYGVSGAQVGHIKRGKSWAHVTGHKPGAAE